MSRSRKKNPITGITCAASEKEDKRRANRRLRRVVKCGIRCTDEEVRYLHEVMDKRDVSNVWTFEKDGKMYYRKDSIWYRKVLRK